MILKAYPPENVQRTIVGMINMCKEIAQEMETMDPGQSREHWIEAVDALAAAKICVSVATDTNYMGHLCLAIPEGSYKEVASMLQVLHEDLKVLAENLRVIGQQYFYGS